MIVRKKLVLSFLLVAIFYSIVGVAAQNPFFLRVATVKEAGSSEADALYQFKSLVEKASGGQIKVLVYTDGVLGTEEDLAEGVRRGTVDAFITASFKYSSFVSEMELLDLPFLFTGEEHWRQVFFGPIGKRLEKFSFERRGDKVLGYMTEGPSILLSCSEIIGLGALHKKKVRVMTYPINITAWKALGAEPRVVARDDLSAALQTGLVDAAESTFSMMKKMRYYEPPSKFVLRTEHSIKTALFLLGQSAYERIPDALRQVIMDCGRRAAWWQVEKGFGDNKTAEEELVSRYWLRVIELQPEEKKIWVEKVLPLQNRIAAKSGLTELLAEIRAAAPPEEPQTEAPIEGEAPVVTNHSSASSVREDALRLRDQDQ